MKRIMFAALTAASVSLLATGCGSDSDSDAAPTTTATSAAQSEESSFADAPATGDVYTDTCNGVLAYIQTLQESGLTDDGRTPESIGEEFLSLAQSESDWAGKSDQEKADFERGVQAAVAGSC